MSKPSTLSKKTIVLALIWGLLLSPLILLIGIPRLICKCVHAIGEIADEVDIHLFDVWSSLWRVRFMTAVQRRFDEATDENRTLFRRCVSAEMERDELRKKLGIQPEEEL